MTAFPFTPHERPQSVIQRSKYLIIRYFGFGAIVIIVQVWGKNAIICYLDP